MAAASTTLGGSHPSVDVLSQPVAILGAGASGLINAYVLLQDGFTNITVITRDRSVGGVWSKDRVYPGLHINNVHGEYRFSPLEMPPPEDAAETGGHISGVMMCKYMETFYSKFLENKVKFTFETEIISVKRIKVNDWEVKVEDVHSGEASVLNFARIILATGGCSNPKIPKEVSLDAAEEAGFTGIVLHSSQFRARLDDILDQVKSKEEDNGAILVVGGGKSAKDMSAKLAREGRRVVNVFKTPDTFIASSFPLPDFIRKSRFLSVLSPHINLNTRLERFLHTTTFGSWIVHFILGKLEETSLSAYSVPKDSPLRPKEGSLFWGIRTNDEGLANPKSYYSLVNAGEIQIIAPARAVGYEKDSVVLDNGARIPAKAVILATGWQSSWTKMFDDATLSELGLGRHTPLTNSVAEAKNQWNYKTLEDPPATHTGHIEQEYVTSLYRGLIPAKNIENRDFAVAGAIFSSNIGYTNEVAAHWISSYFQGDNMRLPSSTEEALAKSELRSAWMARRYPNMLSWVNESYSGTLDFFTWIQCADEMLDDMYLPGMRSGGNWLTWPFCVIDLKEISTLAEERKANR